MPSEQGAHCSCPGPLENRPAGHVTQVSEAGWKKAPVGQKAADREGAAEGLAGGSSVGTGEGDEEGTALGDDDGASLGDEEGAALGK